MKVFISRLGKTIELFFQSKGPATLPILLIMPENIFPTPQKEKFFMFQLEWEQAGFIDAFTKLRN